MRNEKRFAFFYKLCFNIFYFRESNLLFFEFHSGF